MEKKKQAAARLVKLGEAPASMMPADPIPGREEREAEQILDILDAHQHNTDDSQVCQDFEQYQERVEHKRRLIEALRDRLHQRQAQTQDLEAYEANERLLNLLVVYDILVTDVEELVSDYQDDPTAKLLLLLLNDKR